MSRLLGRTAAAVLAFPLAVTVGAAPASADVHTFVAPLCAVGCPDVTVSLARESEDSPLSACVSHESVSGAITVRCTAAAEGTNIVNKLVEAALVAVGDVFDAVNGAVEDVGDGVRDAVDELTDIDFEPIRDAILRQVCKVDPTYC